MSESFNYAEVPYDYGKCAAEDCPKAATCLRHMAFKHIPAETTFSWILNPQYIKQIKGACKFYQPNNKILYAKGFMRTVNALTLQVADTFRAHMIAHLGRKNYYLKRKGGGLLSPADQEYIIAVAKEQGVVLEEYFDGYIESYNWRS